MPDFGEFLLQMILQDMKQYLAKLAEQQKASTHTGDKVSPDDNPTSQGDTTMADQKDTKKTVIAEVVRHKGAGISIPDGVTIPDAIASLKAQMEFEDKGVQILETIPVLPYDGAAILNGVLTDFYGNGAMGTGTEGKGFFDPGAPPRIVSVQCGPNANDVVRVPWGGNRLIGIEGSIETSWTRNDDGTVSFQIEANIKRKDEKKLREVIDEVRRRIKTHSIYRGKAIRIKFRDNDGDMMPVPTISFIDVSTIRDEDLVYSAGVRAQVETSIFTPIEASSVLRIMGVPPKRGVLLHGPFGTGKTLAAYGAAKRAVRADMTFLYLQDASELPDAIHFAKNYGPCVIFAEDIDRQTEGEERTEEIDSILNSLDGVDTKGAELLVVFTTNHIEKINSAMMRPGRLDAVIHVTPPDAEAATTLVQNYSRGMLAPDVDLIAVGFAFNGLIPAVIREAVERAKLFAVNTMVRSGVIPTSKEEVLINTENLLLAAEEVKAQTKLAQKITKPLTAGDQIASGIVRVLRNYEGEIKHEEVTTEG